VTTSDPLELLDAADGLLARADAATSGLWPRVSALLALRALEAAVGRLWERAGVPLGGCPMPTQLICLRAYVADAGLAADAGHAWSALSRASHHHPYELASTAGELGSWFAVVRSVVGRAEGDSLNAPSRRGR
jgi:hypothetical protein